MSGHPCFQGVSTCPFHQGHFGLVRANLGPQVGHLDLWALALGVPAGGVGIIPSSLGQGFLLGVLGLHGQSPPLAVARTQPQGWPLRGWSRESLCLSSLHICQKT